MLQTFTQGNVSVFDKNLHWPHVNVSVIYIYRINISAKSLDVEM
jgi:hypothetical protein